MVLMNNICDLSQFVIVVPIHDKSSTTLADYFFNMMMKFGLYHLVVLDDDNPFKGSFVTMCKTLDLNYYILVKCNHKELSVENFHRFLNKATTITMEDR